MKRFLFIPLLLITLISFSQGSEMITNGSFANGNNWSFAGVGFDISGGSANYTAGSASEANLIQTAASMTIATEASHTYTLFFDLAVTMNRGDVLEFTIMSTNSITYNARVFYYTQGSKTLQFTTPASIGDGGLRFYVFGGHNFTIDNVSMVENAIIGNQPYYVAPNGNDAASGDITHPWKTWQKGIKEAGPGDSIIYRGGVYSSEPVFISPYMTGGGSSGTVNAWINHLAYPGETPILDLAGYISPSQSYEAFTIQYVTYIKLKGLHIRNAKQIVAGINAHGVEAYGCSNLTFENVVVHDIGGPGIRFFGGFGNYDPAGTEIEQRIPNVPADTVRYINCDSYNNCDSLTNGNITLGGLGDGFKFNNTIGAYVLFDNCRSWNNSDDGFDPNGACTIEMINSWSFSNGYLDGDGYGVKTVGPEYPGDAQPDSTIIIRIFKNNIFAYNSDPGISLGFGDARYLAPAHIYNNLAYKNNYGVVQSMTYRGTTFNAISYKNNISYDNTTLNFTSAGVYTAHHNNWQSTYPFADSIPTSNADFVSLDTAQLRGARQANGSLPIITFGHLAATSDLINAGINVGTAYDGTAPDIGVFEYDEGLIAPLVATGLQIAISIRRATARGTVTSDGGATVTERGICYSTSANPTTSNSKVIVAGTTGVFTASLTELVSNTTYHVRSYAINSEGTSYGADETFTTPASSAATSSTGKVYVRNGKVLIIR